MSDRIAFFLAAATTVASMVAALMLPMLDEHTHLAQIAAAADVSSWLDPHKDSPKLHREHNAAASTLSMIQRPPNDCPCGQAWPVATSGL